MKKLRIHLYLYCCATGGFCRMRPVTSKGSDSAGTSSQDNSTAAAD